MKIVDGLFQSITIAVMSGARKKNSLSDMMDISCASHVAIPINLPRKQEVIGDEQAKLRHVLHAASWLRHFGLLDVR